MPNYLQHMFVCYQKLVLNPLADTECYDSLILNCFRNGSFTAKMKSGLRHANCLDEVHEMCANRDMNMAVMRPTPANLESRPRTT